MSTKWDFYSFFFTLSSSSEALSSESLRSSFISFPFSKPVRAIYGENIEKFEVWCTSEFCWVYPEYQDGPHQVEELQDDQEAVEDVVGGEHVDVGLRGADGGVQDTGGE